MYLWSENNETTNQKWVVIDIALINIVSLALVVFAQNSKIAISGNPSRQISIKNKFLHYFSEPSASLWSLLLLSIV
jgi:hypothetical protein